VYGKTLVCGLYVNRTFVHVEKMKGLVGEDEK
jgi:hypothetical protein